MIMVKEFLPKPILIEDLGMVFATEVSKQKSRYGIYECGFCGTRFKTLTANVKRKHTNSCGCYNKIKVSESTKKHGLSNTRLNRIWSNIKDRTLNPKNKSYQNYGGRGISICEEWKNDFMSFYNWAMQNGYSDKLSIDRIDNDGNYCPENCRWVDRIIQSRNQRMSKNNKTGYKGVSFVKARNKYIACLCINKKNKCLGHFLTAEEGAIAYNNYIIENNLEGFILNEIPDKILTND